MMSDATSAVRFVPIDGKPGAYTVALPDGWEADDPFICAIDPRNNSVEDLWSCRKREMVVDVGWHRAAWVPLPSRHGYYCQVARIPDWDVARTRWCATIEEVMEWIQEEVATIDTPAISLRCDLGSLHRCVVP